MNKDIYYADIVISWAFEHYLANAFRFMQTRIYCTTYYFTSTRRVDVSAGNSLSIPRPLAHLFLPLLDYY